MAMRGSSSVGPRSHILVVDDDESNRESMRAVLEDLPYDVAEAATSAQALELLRATQLSLVVVFDMLLPTPEEGERLLCELRDDPELRRHAIVAVTASPQKLTSSVKNLLDTLSAPLILKPFDIDVLLLAVEQAADRCTD